MRLPNDDDPELVALVDRFVQPGRRYLELLHGTFLRQEVDERATFVDALMRDSDAITDPELDVLLSSEWRSRLTASWLIAASKRDQFVDQIGDLLIAGELVYAGQGFCIALSSIGGQRAAARLTEYLDRWLPETGCRYDQAWAMAALLDLDSALAGRFLAPGGLWENWTDDPTAPGRQLELVRKLTTAIRR